MPRAHSPSAPHPQPAHEQAAPSAPARTTPADTLRRGWLLAPLLVAAGPALAQMRGGGMPGRPSGEGMRQEGRAGGPAGQGEAAPPPDLVSGFERRLLPLRLEAGFSADQLVQFDRFALALSELAQHNQRRLQRIFGMQLNSVSVTSPVQAMLGGELRDAEDRLQAVTELVAAWKDLDAMLLPPQRDRVHAVFQAARVEGRARGLAQ
jgi:hypothetical protein